MERVCAAWAEGCREPKGEEGQKGGKKEKAVLALKRTQHHPSFTISQPCCALCLPCSTICYPCCTIRHS